MWKDLLKAARFARHAHGDQLRDEGTPYYKHPMAVARKLWDWGVRDRYTLQAAYLHDTIEDTSVTSLTLIQKFGPAVGGMVRALTRRGPQSEEEYMRRILTYDSDHGECIVRIKLADRMHNNESLHNLSHVSKDKILKALDKTNALLHILANRIR